MNSALERYQSKVIFDQVEELVDLSILTREILKHAINVCEGMGRIPHLDWDGVPSDVIASINYLQEVKEKEARKNE